MGNGSRAPAEVTTLIVWLAMFCAALLGCADSEEPRARRCERFREHLIELRMEGLPEADRVPRASNVSTRELTFA